MLCGNRGGRGCALHVRGTYAAGAPHILHTVCVPTCALHVHVHRMCTRIACALHMRSMRAACAQHVHVRCMRVTCGTACGDVCVPHVSVQHVATRVCACSDSTLAERSRPWLLSPGGEQLEDERGM